MTPNSRLVCHDDNTHDRSMREELASIYTRTVSPQTPPNAATAWEHERLRRAARELVRGKRRETA